MERYDRSYAIAAWEQPSGGAKWLTLPVWLEIIRSPHIKTVIKSYDNTQLGITTRNTTKAKAKAQAHAELQLTNWIELFVDIRFSRFIDDKLCTRYGLKSF